MTKENPSAGHADVAAPNDRLHLLNVERKKLLVELTFNSGMKSFYFCL
jgi:hypothetical protein